MTSWKKVLDIRNCPSCGQDFQPYSRNQVTCSAACFAAQPELVEAKRLRRREQARERGTRPGYREQQNAANRVSNRPHRRLTYLKSNLLRIYGLTYEEYEALIQAQGNRCAICGQPPDPNGRGAHSRLQVDHHHDTGKVRALLCAPCNKGLGHFREDAGLLSKAAEYLAKHM